MQKKDLPVYTFEQFKEIYLNENSMKTYTIQELRNAPIQIKVCSEEQAIQLAYAVGYEIAWRPFKAKYPIYCYLDSLNFPTWNSSENERKSDKPTTIEFNQIKNFMENKKIIGYKLIKPEYEEAALKITGMINQHWTGFSNNKFLKTEKWSCTDYEKYVAKLKEAGVLDLWFEPVFSEEEFKVGDWVTCKEGFLKGDSHYAKKENQAGLGYGYGKTFQVGKIYPSCNSGNVIFPKGEGKGVYFFALRKATPEEIEKASKTVVKMHSSNKGEFEIEVINGKAYYKPENKHLPKEWIRDIINSFGEIIMLNNTKKEKPYNVTISSLNVGCYHNCKKEDWENVYKLLK